MEHANPAEVVERKPQQNGGKNKQWNQNGETSKTPPISMNTNKFFLLYLKIV